MKKRSIYEEDLYIEQYKISEKKIACFHFRLWICGW